MSKDLENMTVADVMERAKRVVNTGKYSLEHASMAKPEWETPFDPVWGTGDCVAFALWSCGINRFNFNFRPGPFWTEKDDAWNMRATSYRDPKTGALYKGHKPSPCIQALVNKPAWIYTDNIGKSNTLFTPVNDEDAEQGDLVFFPSYKSKITKRRKHGHIGLVDSVTGGPQGLVVMAYHLNGSTKKVSFNRFPTTGMNYAFVRPNNRRRVGV